MQNSQVCPLCSNWLVNSEEIILDDNENFIHKKCYISKTDSTVNQLDYLGNSYGSDHSDISEIVLCGSGPHTPNKPKKTSSELKFKLIKAKLIEATEEYSDSDEIYISEKNRSSSLCLSDIWVEPSANLEHTILDVPKVPDVQTCQK